LGSTDLQRRPTSGPQALRCSGVPVKGSGGFAGCGAPDCPNATAAAPTQSHNAIATFCPVAIPGPKLPAALAWSNLCQRQQPCLAKRRMRNLVHSGKCTLRWIKAKRLLGASPYKSFPRLHHKLHIVGEPSPRPRPAAMRLALQAVMPGQAIEPELEDDLGGARRPVSLALDIGEAF
jgi:hypothetical protein